MTTPSRPPSKACDLDITIVSAKHLKNVNWTNGDLKPYVIFWVDPEHRLATKSDDSGSTRPVWNERFVLPLTLPPLDSFLTLEIFHSKPSDTPKPLVGTLRVQLRDLLDSDESTRVKSFELRRPSGRPHGKIRLKLGIRERPLQDYQIAPPPSYYYSSAPPPSHSPARDYRGYNPNPNPSFPYASNVPPPASVLPPPPPPAAPSPPPPYQFSGYTDPYSSYYPGYYSQPPPPPRPFFERQSSYGGPEPSYGGPGPSAPVDNTPYDQKRGLRMGLGSGLAVGSVSGSLGRMTLDEGINYEEEKIAERVESDIAPKDKYGNYRVDY